MTKRQRQALRALGGAIVALGVVLGLLEVEVADGIVAVIGAAVTAVAAFVESPGGEA
jgi:hypothetical protein